MTRDGLRASQDLIEFSAKGYTSGLLSSSSGVFDPRNKRVLNRNETDYNRQSTIHNLVAKRQKALQQ